MQYSRDVTKILRGPFILTQLIYIEGTLTYILSSIILYTLYKRLCLDQAYEIFEFRSFISNILEHELK